MRHAVRGEEHESRGADHAEVPGAERGDDAVGSVAGTIGRKVEEERLGGSVRVDLFGRVPTRGRYGQYGSATHGRLVSSCVDLRCG